MRPNRAKTISFIWTIFFVAIFFSGQLTGRASLFDGDTTAGKRDAASAESASSTTPLLAATPPMGWNSWDGYGTTINEDQLKRMPGGLPSI